MRSRRNIVASLNERDEVRYKQLNPVIAKVKPRTIVEIGCGNGHRAALICAEALNHGPVEYTGLGSDGAEEALDVLKAQCEGFSYQLVDSLTFDAADLVFIDCARPLKEVTEIYESIKDNAGVIVFDGYFEPNKEGFPGEDYGCNKLIRDMNNHVILPQRDPWSKGAGIQLAMWPSSAFPGKVNLVIQTRNCVPNEEILANITYSVPRIKRWLVEARKHSESAVFVSGGPSLKDHIGEIRQWQEKAKIFCVKHSHDVLINAGIVPFGCFLLDPRDHVQDFIENPHPDVIYFTASMVHPTTLNRLLERNARIVGYNAHVGAGEDEVLRKFGRHILIGGGSTSATRGVSALHALGFRDFHLYGYDSCYYEPKDTTVKTKLGYQKYYEAEVTGKKFWTDSELMAQAQDFEKLMKEDKDIDITVYGPGMIHHIWSIMRKVLPDYMDVVNG